jgi:LacI family transcriptional regulator
MMPAKIKDIATYLNISPATVSMALNNRSGISEKTRELVYDAAKKLNYQPVATKYAIATGNGNMPLIIYRKHGRVVSETPFFSALIQAAENEAKRNGFRLSIHYLDGSLPNCREELRVISREADHGFLLLATEMNCDDVTHLLEGNRQCVIMDNAITGISANKVLINNFEGAFKAVGTLLDLGHRNIGYLHSKVWITNFAERYAGFRSAISGAGLELNQEWICNIDSTHEGAYADMRAWLEKSPKLPTAFFADNDIIAMGAMKAMREWGIDIPGDVSIIGFDDMSFCTMVEPNLSSMRVDTHNIGSIAVGLLLQNNDFFQKIEIDTRPMIRESVRELK